MARIPRGLTVREGSWVHKVWRGHNREDNLGTPAHKERYLQYMNEDLESEKYESGSVVQAITVMSNHSHEVGKVEKPKLFSNHMRRHHSRYGRYFNDFKERCGKVAQDRPHTTLIEDESHLMKATLYVHANPLRAKMPDAERYAYSTHLLYAYGKRLGWMKNIQLPEWYLRLGRNATTRQQAYRKLFAWFLRTYGSEKLSILKGRFFGALAWIKQNEEAVTAWRKSRIPAPAPVPS